MTEIDKMDFCGELCLFAEELIQKAREPKWIPVTERLPKEDGKYLCFHHGKYANWIQAVQFAKDARKFDEYAFKKQWKNKWLMYDSEYGYYAVDYITHWIPLPEPPNEETP